MVKIQPNRPFRADVPEEFQGATQGREGFIAAAAFVAQYKYATRPPTLRQWAAMLRKMRFHGDRIATLKAELAECYTTRLDFDEWFDLIEQLAVLHIAITHRPDLR